MTVDIAVFTAHPDDAEASMGGTLLSYIAKGKTVGIADLTRGELGTHGCPDTRSKEAEQASNLLGLHTRYNFGLEDGFFEDDKASRLAVIQLLRSWRPETVFLTPPDDRHPDHGRASTLFREAAFYSGLAKIQTLDEQGKEQEPWRPKHMFYCILGTWQQPDFVVDISSYWEKKLEVMRAYKSQFHCPVTHKESKTDTVISNKDFWPMFESRARTLGQMIGVSYGEGFLTVLDAPVGISDPTALL